MNTQMFSGDGEVVMPAVTADGRVSACSSDDTSILSPFQISAEFKLFVTAYFNATVRVCKCELAEPSKHATVQTVEIASRKLNIEYSYHFVRHIVRRSPTSINELFTLVGSKVQVTRSS